MKDYGMMGNGQSSGTLAVALSLDQARKEDNMTCTASSITQSKRI